jgi:NAD-dependent protein deacetylases, SIR2 family
MKLKTIVVFTGAGISAESGIQTFRDADGLWHNHRIEDVATPRAWKKNPQLVLDFYNQRRRNIKQALPNEAHIDLAQLEEQYDVHIITQNIDDLHERAGSKMVTHLHGEIFKMRSEKNESLVYPIFGDIKIGDKAEDGAQLRPHIVWFEEAVPMMETAIDIAMAAEHFVVIGTSLQVYPAASLLHYIPEHIPITVIDKSLPSVHRKNVTYIEQPATLGVKKWIKEIINNE